MAAKDLSKAQCVLLTVHYASNANIKALHSFTPTRSDALDPDLILRILLTYLPESTEPRDYTSYVEEVASRLYLDYDRQDVDIDIGPVKDIPEKEAERKVKKLHLLEAIPPTFPPHAPDDLLTRFLCHRAYRIDEETGLIHLVPQLIEPFLDRNDYLRTWFVSIVLPILRLETDYYPDEGVPEISLGRFEALEGREGIDFLLQKGLAHDGEVPISGPHSDTTVARDVKGLVGPWMYGHTERKRRKLDRDEQVSKPNESDSVDDLEGKVRKISLTGVKEEDKTGHDWEYFFAWLVTHAQEHFPVITHCIEDWDGPGDVDLGGFAVTGQGGRSYLDEEVQQKLELQYAQAAFATCYVAEDDSQETVKGAHGILARLAELLDFIPPPDLASSVDSLPRIERHARSLDKSHTVADLAPESLLAPEHPLTTPRMETYMLLQMMVYSAYQFLSLGHPMSLVNVAKLHFYAEAEEQKGVLQKILRHLSKSGARKDETQWASDRAKLMWLWNWGIEEDDEKGQTGAGVLGKIKREAFEEEMLKCFVDTNCFQMAVKLYLPNKGGPSLLSKNVIEDVVLAKAMEAYDGSSNGNRTRGGMKKANDIISVFRPRFSTSTRFREANALIAATHSLSFYSLTLQHGVPFQPVSIRVSSDPVGLIDKVLEQNPRSYTKLDDLIGIAQNLVASGSLLKQDETETENSSIAGAGESVEKRKKQAERRVTFMAVEAALREDDFETAYSYIVNRLTPSGADIEAPSQAETQKSHKRNTSAASTASTKGRKRKEEDDISWRAAFLAGRYRPSTTSPPTLRRLEQRTELLSLALLLAPTSHLTEILAVWRRCEEEMTSLQASQQAAEEDFDDRADKRQSALPGNFTISGEQPELVLNQKRREMGCMQGGSREAEEDTPLSMFDLTRSAARAFSKNAFPLSAAARSSGEQPKGMDSSVDSLASARSGEGQQRVRRRDMVANAVTGGLTSGLGWVLGATPASQQQGHEQER